MTEDEAKEKWCPHTVIAGGYNRLWSSDAEDGTVRADRVDASANCIGSRCMSWRWRTLCDGQNEFPHEDGYCGLAGKPE